MYMGHKQWDTKKCYEKGDDQGHNQNFIER